MTTDAPAARVMQKTADEIAEHNATEAEKLSVIIGAAIAAVQKLDFIGYCPAIGQTEGSIVEHLSAVMPAATGGALFRIAYGDAREYLLQRGVA